MALRIRKIIAGYHARKSEDEATQKMLETKKPATRKRYIRYIEKLKTLRKLYIQLKEDKKYIYFKSRPQFKQKEIPKVIKKPDKKQQIQLEKQTGYFAHIFIFKCLNESNVIVSHYYGYFSRFHIPRESEAKREHARNYYQHRVLAVAYYNSMFISDKSMIKI